MKNDKRKDVKTHKWFKGVDFDALFQRRVNAPIIPEVEHEGDTNYFEKYDDPAGILFFLYFLVYKINIFFFFLIKNNIPTISFLFM